MHEIHLTGPAKNALGSAMMQHLVDELARADGQPVLLTGQGDAFSAGLDLREVAAANDASMAVFLDLLIRMTVALYTHPAPTVAWVNGHAIAGGAVLALCCDYRIGTPNPRARIGLNEVAIGLLFPPTVLRIMRAALSQPASDTVILGGELHPPEAALRLGILHEIAEDGLSRARDRLALLGGYSPQAYAGTKAELRAAVVRRDPEAEGHYRDEVLPLWTSAPMKAKILERLER